jgi:hypothetical protein
MNEGLLNMLQVIKLFYIVWCFFFNYNMPSGKLLVKWTRIGVN